ncbi:hypothetical protein GBA52_027328 [Prunus armeniaca]|nr:hypothetical protein GBA52_027328 [Prunus armeniaca]
MTTRLGSAPSSRFTAPLSTRPTRSSSLTPPLFSARASLRQELRNLVASALNEKSRSQVTENLHNIRGRFLADILRVLRHMALDLCKTPLPFLWRKTGPSVTVGRWDPLLESLGLYIRQKVNRKGCCALYSLATD